jgi:hypothetical protein
MRVVMDDVARWTEARGLGAAEPLRAWAEDVADGNIRARRRCRQAPRAVGAGQARPHGPDMVGASAGFLLLMYSSPLITDLHGKYQFWLIPVIFWLKIANAFEFCPGDDFSLTYTDDDTDVVMLDDM